MPSSLSGSEVSNQSLVPGSASRGPAMAVTTPTRERTVPFISHKSQDNNMT